MTSTRILGVSALALIVAVSSAGCSSSKKAAAGTSQSSVSTPATTPAAVSSTVSSAVSSAADTTATTSAAAGSLSGAWTGSYSGAYSGTFTLNWTQSGSKLSGTIDLSTAGMSPLNGVVAGNHISFGTVGSTVITYTGTVSGSTMSGSYQIAAGAGGTGSWSAHRS